MFVRSIGFAAAVLALVAPCLAGTQIRTSAFEYDSVSGQLIREIIEPDNSALCLVTTYSYDAFGNRTGATTRNCNGTSSGGVTEAAAPAGDPVFVSRTSSSAFAAGSVVINAITYNWSAGQFATSSTNAVGHTETRAFDPRFGGVTSLTGPNGLTTTWTYDSFGRKASETRADGTVANWFYERCVDLIAGTCPNYAQYRVRVTATSAPVTSTYYDSLAREIRTETQGFDGTLVRQDTLYDGLGRVSQVTRPYYFGASTYTTTVFAYDILGRVYQAVEPPTSTGQVLTVTTYNGLITTVMVTNLVNGVGSGTGLPGGVTQSRTTIKNSQGQVVQVKDTQNNILGYTYDEFGNLKTTTDALGNVTTLTNDLRGRKTQMVDPDMGSWTYAYNALGELVRQTDAKGQTATMAYDVLGRMTSRSEPDLASTWIYDSCLKGIGKLCQASATNGYSRSQSYDSLGRPATLTATIDTAYSVTTTYDSSGRVDTMTYPTGFAVRNIYNPYGYLWKAQRADAGGSTVFWTANAKSASGQVTSELLGNNLSQTRTFDVLDRLSSVAASGTGGTVHSFSYAYDAIGNVTQRVDNVQAVTESFAYDNLNRLTMASGAAPSGPLVTRSFDYNPIGNMIYKSDVGTYTYPASGIVRPHAVSSVSGPVNATYSYDANGNQISGAGRSLTYTSFNMPLTITASAATYTYTYSPEHQRVRLVTALATGTQTSIYLHPGGAGLFYEKEIKPDATLEHKHYVNAEGILVGVYVTKSAYATGDGPQMRYYHRDSLGSIMAITNESGARIETLAYEAFGKRRFPNGTADPGGSLFGITTDRGFTAHEHLDELGLVHMNGRVYDPLLGRFMTADPFVQAPSNLQSYNRYSYVWNNPLAYSDPSGYFNVFKKRDWAKLTTKILEQAGRNKYLGGLHQTWLLSSTPFGIGYGTSTGDWTTVGRATATMAVLAGSMWAGGAAWGAYNGTVIGAGIYLTESTAIGYASSYATAWIYGASDDEARHAALLSAKRAAVMAGARIGYNAWVGDDVTLKPGENRPDQPRYTPDPVTGRQSPSDANMNVLTLNRDLDSEPTFLNAITQNQPLSRALNMIPGANAFARLDDYWYNARLLPDSGFLYPVSIPVAVIITYGGLINSASVYFLPGQLVH